MTAMISIALLMSVFGSSMVSAALTPSTSIAINGNSDLDLFNYPGTGTASDPKVIANLSIDGNGGVGISINNVSLHITIYNCTIYNSITGIEIVGSNNITVDNNTITGASGSHGIFLVSSAATLDRNKLTGCSIELRHSDSNVGVQAYIDAMTITSHNTINGASVYFLKNQNMNRASVPSGAGEVILLNVTYANVNGLNMRGGAVLFWCSNIVVENNIITGAYDAIYAFSSNYCTYANNRIVDAYHAGVRLYMSSQNTVSNTTITHNAIYSTAYGIVVIYGSTNVIVGSTVRNTYAGITLSYTIKNTVSDNLLIHSMGDGIYIESSNNNSVSDNILNGSSLRGIHIQLSNGNVFFNNTIDTALNSGIILWRSFGNIIDWNKIFHSVSYGINLTACNGAVNRIYANVLIGNNGSTSVYNPANIQAFDDSVNNWQGTIISYGNGTIGNYWGDWTAPDSNKDGIVDSPYVIAGGAMDNYPVALSVKILSPASNLYTKSTTVVLSGITSGYVLADVTWYNAAAGTSGQGSGSSSWTASVGLVQGVNNIFVNATDGHGLKVSDNVTVICDTIGPNLTLVSPASGSINTTGTVTVQWNASDALSGIALTEISTDGTTWTTVTGNSHNLTLADSVYIVYVKVTDNVGNVNQTSVSFTVEASVPTVIATAPVGSGVSKGATITVQFSEAMNQTATTILVDGITGVLTWSGNTAVFTPSSALAYNTTYTLSASGKDVSGKALAATGWTFTTLKDECKITGTLLDVSGNATVDAKVTLSNGLTTETDANGYFEFNKVASGSYTLTISKDGYKTVTQNVTTAAGETTALGTLSAEANPPGTDDTLLIAVGVIVILALLVGGVLVLKRRKKE